MSSMEMGDYPFVSSSDGFGELVNEDRVDTAFGKVKVSIYGDRSREAIVTFHDLGMDGNNLSLNEI